MAHARRRRSCYICVCHIRCTSVVLHTGVHVYTIVCCVISCMCCVTCCMCIVFQAVCCSDHLHCCPSGSTCDVAKGTCKNSGLSVPWQRKTPALKTSGLSAKGNPTCPGGGGVCPKNSTCCKMPSGQYGCCPYPKVGFL